MTIITGSWCHPYIRKQYMQTGAHNIYVIGKPCKAIFTRARGLEAYAPELLSKSQDTQNPAAKNNIHPNTPTDVF